MQTDLTKLDRRLFHISMVRDFGDRTPEICFIPHSFEPGFNETLITFLPNLMEITNTRLICVDGISISLSVSALPQGCEVVDISDRELAVAAVERLSRVSHASQFETLFAQLSAEVHAEGRTHLSPPLAKFLKELPNITDDIASQLPILMAYAASLNILLSPYKQLNYLLNTITIESEIDFDAANREQNAILERMGQVLSDPFEIIVRSMQKSIPELQNATPNSMVELGRDGPSDPQRFVERFQNTALARVLSSFGEGTATAPTAESLLSEAVDACSRFKREVDNTLAEFQRKQDTATSEFEADDIVQVNEMILDAMPILGLQPDEFVNFVRNSHYRRRFHSIDIIGVVRELSALWNAVMRRLAQSPADQAYTRVTRQLELLPVLLKGASQSADIAALELLDTGDMHTDLCEDLAQLVPQSTHVETFRALESEFTSDYENAMAYYGHMKTAGDRFVERTLAAMRERRNNSSLLLIGGFHTDVVQSKLGERRISFATLIPRWAGKSML